MRLLFDECLPRALKRRLIGHACRSVQEMGWARKWNGNLLSLAERSFDVFVTMDHSLEYQQNLTNRKMGILAFRARSNQIEDLLPLIPAALVALNPHLPGHVIRIE